MDIFVLITNECLIFMWQVDTPRPNDRSWHPGLNREAGSIEVRL